MEVWKHYGGLWFVLFFVSVCACAREEMVVIYIPPPERRKKEEEIFHSIRLNTFNMSI